MTIEEKESTSSPPWLTSQKTETDAPFVVDADAPKSKRTRRTKAQMAAARGATNVDDSPSDVVFNILPAALPLPPALPTNSLAAAAMPKDYAHESWRLAGTVAIGASAVCLGLSPLSSAFVAIGGATMTIVAWSFWRVTRP